jgi:endonuclease/exonuclease/phosphatase family metal-dependent hydrolase
MSWFARSIPPVLGVLLLLSSCDSRGDSPAVDSPTVDSSTVDTMGDRADPEPLTLRIMSFNLRWGGFDDGVNSWENRRELAYQVIRHFAPDSAGLQEPTTEQVADVVTAIGNLKSYEYDGRTQQIVYDASRFELEDAGGFLLFEGNEQRGSTRHCTWVHLVERRTGRGYYHYNVHLDHRNPRSRQLSAVRLVQAVAGRATADPFVVTGDLNASESSATMSFLRGEQTLPDELGNPVTNPVSLVDTFRVVNPGAPDVGTAGGFEGHRTGAKIDFVLVEPEIGVDQAEIDYTNTDGSYPSDHFPVTAVITIPYFQP